MKKLYIKIQFLILFSLLCFTRYSCFAQSENTLASVVESYHKVSNTFQNVKLFSEQKTNVALNSQIKNDGLEGKATLLTINSIALNSILQNPSMTLSLTIPNGTNNPTELELFRVQIISNDFKLNILDSKRQITETPTPNNIIHYQGIIKNNSKSVVAFSFSNNEIIGLVSDSLSNYTIGKIKDTQTYFYCNSTYLPQRQETQMCGVTDKQNINNDIKTQSNETGCKVLRISTTVDYDYYVACNNNIGTVNEKIQGNFNQVAAIFRNDGIAIQLVLIDIYKSPSSYSDITNEDLLLDIHRDITGINFDGEISCLIINRRMDNAGGIAFLNGICNNRLYSKAVIRLDNYYENYPDFTQGVKTFAHEIGHVLGSKHTHDCAWNGNNTAIDNCERPTGNCNNGPNPVNGGTIMSYCNQPPLANGFGPQPSTLIRNNINTRTCFPINNNKPKNLETYNYLSSPSVELSWEDPIGINSSLYQIEYKKTNESSWTTILNENGGVNHRNNTYIINGLNINTEYQWHVKTECSDWAMGTFKGYPTFGDIAFSKYVFCQGQSSVITLPIEGSQHIYSFNSFNVELSDASGSFASPTVIGYKSGRDANDIPITIPNNIPSSTKYRVRIVLDFPSYTKNSAYDVTIGTEAPILQATTTCPDSYTSISRLWEKAYGGNKEDELRQIIPTNDGGTLLFGSSKSESSSSTDKSDVNRGNYDYWLVKMDGNNNKVWDRALGGTDADLGSYIIPTADGGYLLGGSSYSGISGEKSQDNVGGNNGTTDYWIVKVSSNGYKIWDKRFGGSLNDELKVMIQTPDGGFLLAGRSNSPANGSKSKPNYNDSYDFWIMKITGNGTIVTDWVFGGNAEENLTSFIQTSDGGYLLGGSTKSDNNGGDISEPTRSGWDYWIVKVDANFNKLWNKRYGGGADDSMATNGIAVASDGNYIIAGRSDSNVTGDKNEPSWFNTPDYWVLKVNSQNRNIIKQHRFGGGGEDGCNSLLATPDGGFLLAGGSNSNATGNKSEPSWSDSYDYWIVKVDANLEMKWNKRFGGGADDYGMTLSPTLDGNFMMGGFSNSNKTGDKVADISKGLTDYWMVKFNDCQTSSSTTVNIGQKAFLSAKGCLGTITWSNGATTNNIVVSPTTTTTYTATCYYGCTSNNSTILNVTVIPCSSPANMFSLKSGLWSEISTWSCNTIPLLTDTIKISNENTVTIDLNDGHAKQVDVWGMLKYINGGKLHLNK